MYLTQRLRNECAMHLAPSSHIGSPPCSRGWAQKHPRGLHARLRIGGNALCHFFYMECIRHGVKKIDISQNAGRVTSDTRNVSKFSQHVTGTASNYIIIQHKEDITLIILFILYFSNNIIGIGSSSPTTPFHISTGATNSPAIYITNDSTGRRNSGTKL